jgi:TPP-dependent pyruvate/acetoin dehydrogenase alpha subunit
VLSQGELQRMRSEVQAEVEAALVFARHSADPEPKELLEDLLV